MCTRWTVRSIALVLGLFAVTANAQAGDPAKYNDRFRQMWLAIHDPNNGYFSSDGVPYHSPETLVIEAPDYGHETTSEAFSYWLWLEAAQGRLTGDWSGLTSAWSTLEKYSIPSQSDQPTNSFYNASSPATYAPEGDDPSAYPARLDSNVKAGQDPLADELATAYGTKDVFGMHWILDVDNWYGYGSRADGVSKPSYINTFQRGAQESVWEVVPQPCWDEFKFGGKNGYLDLFIGDTSYAQQWKYSNAPDADARVVQVLYWASVWAAEQGKAVSTVPAAKASRMGDYLRYALFDKYFKTIGCQSTSCTPGSDCSSAHYLLSWYYAWGGSVATSNGWAWRTGSSHAHFGYQNPLAAYALSQVAALKPISSKGASDWATSLTRQLEFYQWLQTKEGAIAGGATNSYKGRYEAFPAGVSTFHGMAYDEAPVYRDPPSNQWFGWQAWSMQRVAEYYLVTGNAAAGALLDRWVAWVESAVKLPADGTYQIPSTLSWSGQPQTWAGSYATNANLHVTVENTTNDVGVTASLVRTLAAYSAGKAKYGGGEDAASRDLAKALLDRMWTLYRDSKGVSVAEPHDDFHRIFDQPVYIPSGWTGTMPNGDAIKAGVKFLDLRSKYKADPDFARIQSAISAGQTPEMRYHRFWAQAEFALANADFARLFAAGQATNRLPTVKFNAPANGATFAVGANIQLQADASDPDGAVAKVEFFTNGSKLGEAATAPYKVQWTGVAEGRHTLVATATDNQGATWSDQIAVVVGNPPANTGGGSGSGTGGGGGGSGGTGGGSASGGTGGGSGSGGGGGSHTGGGSGRADGGSLDGGTDSSVAGGGCGCGSASLPEGVASLFFALTGLGARRRRSVR